jgi:hypothetical protein
MSNPVASNEIHVVIRPIKPPGFEPEQIPAQLFKKIYDSFLAAFLAADREIHMKSVASTFFVSYLSMGSCQFGIVEKQKAFGRDGGSAIDLFTQCARQIHRSDYPMLTRYPRLARAFRRIAKALDPSIIVVVQHCGAELSMDDFFCRQLDRVGSTRETIAAGDCWFAGAAMTAFEGRLSQIDYRGVVWSGRLLLNGGEAEIECVFDKSKGEDAFNAFGNKAVSVAGRAIFTGDSPLPERIEVMRIEARAESGLGAADRAAPPQLTQTGADRATAPVPASRVRLR